MVSKIKDWFGDAFRDFKNTVQPYFKQKINSALGTIKTITSSQTQTQLKTQSSMSNLQRNPSESTTKLSDLASKFKTLSNPVQENSKRVTESTRQIFPENKVNTVTVVPHDDSPYKVRYRINRAKEEVFSKKEDLISRSLEILESVQTPFLSDDRKIRLELYGTISVGAGNKYSIASICHDTGGYFVEMEPSPTGSIQEININGETYFSRDSYLGKKGPSKVYLHEGENTISTADMVLQFTLPASAKP